MSKTFAVQEYSGPLEAAREWSLRTGLRLVCLILVLLNTACSTTNIASRTPGDGVWINLSASSATMKALKDPKTWMPAAAALLIASTDSDQRISDWASEHNPVFGSQSGAQAASDNLRTVLASSAVITSVMPPGKLDALLPGRTGSLATASMAALATSQVTGALKDSTDRERPNGVDKRSFPSSHTAAASTYATLSAQRVDGMALSLTQRRRLKTGFHAVAAATAWARVEAQAHYPADVLMGFALGNFTAVLMQESLQNSQRPVWFGIDRDRTTDTFLFQVGWPF